MNGAEIGTIPVDSHEYTSGESATVLANTGALDRMGYKFTNWNTHADGSGSSYNPGDKVEIISDLTLYAQWGETYNVTYQASDAESGTVPTDTHEYASGSQVEVLGNTGSLTLTGYRFMNWNTKQDGTGTVREPGGVFNITANTVLYAQWIEEAKYSVTYIALNAESGTVPIDTTDYYYGDTATASQNTGNLVRTGYALYAWNTQSDGNGVQILLGENFTVQDNVTLYAQWAETFTVTYLAPDAESGDVPVDPGEYTAGQNAEVSANTGGLARSGYNFAGWNTQQNGLGTAYSPGDNLLISGDATLYAQWVEIFTVTYLAPDAESGDVPVDSGEYTAGQSVEVSANTGNLVKSGNVFIGWNTQQDGSGTTYMPGDIISITGNITLHVLWEAEITLNAMNVESGLFDAVTCYKAYEGVYSIIYVESGSNVTIADAIATADEFDTSIYQQIVSNFGNPEDVDANGKTILFLLDIQDGYTGSGGYVAGFFDPTHMYDTSTQTYSNEADMLFMDIYPSVVGSEEFYSTIAHEFQHLINFSNTTLVNGVSQDLWINEGLSSGAEYVYSGEVNQNRVDWFNADPLGTIAYGNNFFVWNGYWESQEADAVLDNYATVNLFFQWLRIHASNGTGIYKEILSSSNRDYRAVTGAASTYISSSFGTWSTLLRTWHIANIICRTSGYYGYDQELSVAMPGFASSNNYEWVFSPGEGIVSAMPVAGSNTPPASGTNIRYCGIDISTGSIDTIAPYSGDIAFVFNANTDNTSADETGYVANIENASVLSLLPSVHVSRPIPESWIVDVYITPDKGFVLGGSIGKNLGLPALSAKRKILKAEYNNE